MVGEPSERFARLMEEAVAFSMDHVHKGGIPFTALVVDQGVLFSVAASTASGNITIRQRMRKSRRSAMPAARMERPICGAQRF
ncbi:hypothetical protein [Neoaquamicrobium sediminum]|uniref:hypothetical protein n=1 Tax=Neoaquamicrobium sediminum TaxID=1849104 RepID=UPI0035E464D6